MSVGLQQAERQALTRYFEQKWKRSELSDGLVPDPGHGLDELTPIAFYAHPFDAHSQDSLDALGEFAVRDVSGYSRFVLTMLDGPWVGQQVGLAMPAGNRWALQLEPEVAVVPQGVIEAGATTTFVMAGGDTFTATLAGGDIQGSGFITLQLNELGPGGPGNRGYFDTGRRGLRETRLVLNLVLALPKEAAPLLPEQYAAAAMEFLNGVDLVGNEAAPAGSVARVLGDAGIRALRQDARQIGTRFNYIGDYAAWAWYILPVPFKRQFVAPEVGLREVTAA